MKCNYCSHQWQTRTKNPIRCPLCGNPVGYKPSRKLTGRFSAGLPEFRFNFGRF